jgi:uncharacterized protein (TIGR03435 family)
MRVTHPAALGSLIFLLALTAYCQEFEVADVRVNKLDEPPSGAFLPSGQLTLRGVTMRTLVGIAFKESRVLPEVDATSIALSPSVAQFNTFAADYLKGAPPWLNADRFDVVAKAPPGTPMDTLRVMVQKLLAERFHLVVHRETKVMKVYALVVATGGPKLKEPQVPGDPVCIRSISEDNTYHRDCHNMTMRQLAEQLPAFAPRFFEGKPVLDATDLKGAWDFKLDWTPLTGGLAGLDAAPGAEFDTGTTIFRTMEKNLGLKLEQREQPMPIIVIDQVDRVPTEN